MSSPVALPPRERLPIRRRLLPLAAVGIARLLAKAPPARIRAVLELARRGTFPASVAQALAARREVVAVSLRCVLGSGPLSVIELAPTRCVVADFLIIRL
jgi:hypothetical protein